MARNKKQINIGSLLSDSTKNEDVEGRNFADIGIGNAIAREIIIVLIEERTLIRECLARCISADLGCSVVSFENISRWQDSVDIHASLIIFSVGNRDYDYIHQLSETGNAPLIVIFSDAADLDSIAEGVRCGVRGHVPTNTALHIAVAALRLVLAGSIFVPAECLLNTCLPAKACASDGQEIGDFSPRQNTVVDALGQGKTNKLIAFELGISENTVKVHVHNIMKKMLVKNRTEAALKICARTNGAAH
jgi:DNA-binding NarL/FixJ family response regulator